MKYSEFENLFTQLRVNLATREEWLDSLPRSIRDSYFDNEFVDSLYSDTDLLLKSLFKGPLLDDIEYFLTIGTEYNIIKEGVEYEIKTVEDMLKYFKEGYEWGQDA